MWTLLALALIASAAASPASQTLSHQYQMQSARNNMMSHQLTSTVQDQLKKSCQRHADNEAYERIINVRNSAIQEVQGAAMQEITKAVEEGEQPNYLRVFCKVSPTIKRSVNRMVTALKPCMNPQSREELGQATNVTESFLNYVCYNDGEKVIEFVRNGGIDCISERQTGLGQCVESAISEEEDENEIGSDIFNSEESLNKEERDKKMADECREASELESCIKRELDQCANQSSSTFVVGLLESLLKPVCEKYTRN